MDIFELYMRHDKEKYANGKTRERVRRTDSQKTAPIKAAIGT